MNYKAVLENSIMQKDQPATAGSKMLENFISPIDATVAVCLESAGIEIVGRCGSDEFGASGLFANPETAHERRDGSAVQEREDRPCVHHVLSGEADFVLCNDYTGAISSAAAAQGFYYIHPTYGTVSRYGLIPSASSMDQIGILCKTPEVGFDVLKIIAGYDSKDGIMGNSKTEKTSGGSQSEQNTNNPVQKRVEHIETELKYSEIFTQVMQILCVAELSNNISRYDGIKYGYRAKDYKDLNELYKKSRTEAFGEDVKLAAILGAMVLSQENYTRYYDKAMLLRRLIKDSLKFDNYDVLTYANAEHKRFSSGPHVLSRLCGLPALTTPDCTYIANAGREDVLEVIAKSPQKAASKSTPEVVTL